MMRLLHASIAAAALAMPAAAHGFHVSAGELDVNRATSSLEVAIALSAEDLELALSRQVGARVRLEDEGAEELCATYVARNFRLGASDGRVARPSWVGWETELFTTWVYFELPFEGAPETLAGWTLENRLLFDVARDQANTLRLRGGRRASTTTFTDARPRREITAELGFGAVRRQKDSATPARRTRSTSPEGASSSIAPSGRRTTKRPSGSR